MKRSSLLCGGLLWTVACGDTDKTGWPTSDTESDDVSDDSTVEDDQTDTDEPVDDPDDPTETETDWDDPVETDSDTEVWDDPWTESETDTEDTRRDTGDLLLIRAFGHAGAIDIDKYNDESGLLFDGYEFTGYYNPYYYGDWVCQYALPAWGQQSQYECDQCDYAMDITGGGVYEVWSDVSGSFGSFCEDVIGVSDGDTGTFRGDTGWFKRPIGFASAWRSGSTTYNDVAVYYFGSPYNNWYPVAYAYGSDSYFYWLYTFSSYYYY